jgi:transcriptional regulator with XRE-family HTH domain
MPRRDTLMSDPDDVPVPSADEERQRRLAERLREAREYLGLSQQLVADHTRISRVAISAIENGKRKVEALELETLAALYRRPVTYFLDGALEEPAIVRALAREAAALTDRDREEVLRFAQFLKSYAQDRDDPSPRTGTTG